MFNEIQQYKKGGLNRPQVSQLLKVSYNTVCNYWNKDIDDYKSSYNKVHHKNRTRKAEIYRDEIIGYLNYYQGFSAAQIYDRLLEKHGDELLVKERTIRSYVKELREELSIPKHDKRDYVAVEDPSPGKQAQVDFGEIILSHATKKRPNGEPSKIKVYVFSMVLAHSRYKYAYWQDHPFTTNDAIKAHQKAFEFFEGRPEEIVYDQDSVLVVNENYGDIVFTKDFDIYLKTQDFKAYVCRGG